MDGMFSSNAASVQGRLTLKRTCLSHSKRWTNFICIFKAYWLKNNNLGYNVSNEVGATWMMITSMHIVAIIAAILQPTNLHHLFKKSFSSLIWSFSIKTSLIRLMGVLWHEYCGVFLSCCNCSVGVNLVAQQWLSCLVPEGNEAAVLKCCPLISLSYLSLSETSFVSICV